MSIEEIVTKVDPAKPFFKSKKWWAMVITGIVSTGTAILMVVGGVSWQFILATLIGELTPAIAYILAQAGVDKTVYSKALEVLVSRVKTTETVPAKAGQTKTIETTTPAPVTPQNP